MTDYSLKGLNEMPSKLLALCFSFERVAVDSWMSTLGATGSVERAAGISGELHPLVTLDASKIIYISEVSWVEIQLFYLHTKMASEDITQDEFVSP